MFIKAKNEFVIPIYTKVNPKNDSFEVDGDKKVILLNEFWSPEMENITSFIPKRYHDDFYITLMTMVNPLAPHIHTDLYTILNFYVDSDNSKTTFYKPKNNLKVNSSTNNYLSYKKEDLVETGHFIAKNNEVYLLDAREIHDIQPLGEWKPRKIIHVRTDKHTYLDVCEMLKETGNL